MNANHPQTHGAAATETAPALDRRRLLGTAGLLLGGFAAAQAGAQAPATATDLDAK